MRVLITGGAGYIGSHTAKALAAAGFEPVTLDNLSTGHRGAARGGRRGGGDGAGAARLRAVLRDERVEAVVHFAASAYVGESMRDPRRYFRNNVANTLALLDAMLDAGVEAIVFSSSCTTYGVPESLPIAEDHPQRPVNPSGIPSSSSSASSAGTARRTGSAGRRCGTSTRPAPTRTGRSARTTTRKPT